LSRATKGVPVVEPGDEGARVETTDQSSAVVPVGSTV
jgi:hypothetical protein